MKTLLLLIFNLSASIAISQVPTTKLNTQDRKFFQTIINLTEYLKVCKTTPLTFHESPTYTKDESFYDEIINNYFDKEKTRHLLMKDTLVFGYEGKIDMIRHILNGVDYFLDIIPPDSIFVRPFNSEKFPNTIEVYLLVNSKEIPILLCHFESSSALLIGLSAGASPKTEEFDLYLKRQKNYYEFPNWLNKN